MRIFFKEAGRLDNQHIGDIDTIKESRNLILTYIHDYMPSGCYNRDIKHHTAGGEDNFYVQRF